MCNFQPLPCEATDLGDPLEHLEDIWGVLSQTPGLSRLSRADTALLCRSMSLHAAGRDRVLLGEGTTDDHMIILLTGEAWLAQDTRAHGATPVQRIQPGMAVGVRAMLDEDPEPVTCVSATPVDFLRLERAAFNRMAAVQPRLAMQLLVALMHGMPGSGGVCRGTLAGATQQQSALMNKAC
jgi:CRP-like cAMP-binding protein